MNSRTRSLVCAALLTALPVAGQVIPPERLIPWDPGVRSGIPATYYSVDVTEFGAVGDGVTDDGPAFNAAIAASATPGFVWVPPGSYRIATIVEMKSDVVLQGAGPEESRLLFDLPAFGFRGGIEFNGSMEGSEILVLAGAAFGSTELTLDSAAGLSPGDVLWLFQDDDDALMYTADYWRTNYSPHSMGQVVGIEAIDGDDVTLDTPLRLDYRLELAPRVRRIQPIENAGVEGLYLERTDTADAYTVSLTYAQNCWLRYNESNVTFRSHVWAFYSRFLTVSDNYFHHAHDYGGGGHGYGVTLADCTSDVLVTNNVFHTLRHAMMVKEGANGNVFGYNYSFDNRNGADASCHGHYNYGNLFEGNVVEQIVVSDWWGPSGPLTTLFRNRSREFTGISVRDHSDFTNVVGNTTGRIEVRKGPDIIIFGYPVYMGEVEEELVDANLIDGTLEWSGDPDPLELPASHYLAEAPPFWGPLPWPAIGADVDETNDPDLRIPAQYRYDLIEAGEWRPPIPEILTQDELIVGAEATLTVINATPGEHVYFAFGYDGQGLGPCLEGLGGLCIDVVNAQPLGFATADAAGTAELTVVVPEPGSVEMTTQAMIPRGPDASLSVKTNAITAPVSEPPE